MRQGESPIKSFLEENNLVLAYRGQLFSELMFRLLDVLESELDNSGIALNRVKKAFMIGVESMQNILEHAATTDGSSVILSFSNDGEKINLITGNYITEKQSDYLGNFLNELSLLSKDELRDLYKTKMTEVHPSENKGGLGLIYLMKMKGVDLTYRIIGDGNKKWFEINIAL